MGSACCVDLTVVRSRYPRGWGGVAIRPAQTSWRRRGGRRANGVACGVSIPVDDDCNGRYALVDMYAVVVKSRDGCALGRCLGSGR